MKKIYILSLIVIILVLFSFTKYNTKKYSININAADNISIYYGLSSYAMFSSDENTIKTLSNHFNNLTFEPKKKEMDFPTMFIICFYKNEKQIAKITVDKNNIFRLNDNSKTLKLSSGTFNYDYIHDIYEESKKIKK